ncbi:MAG: YgaP family membrane protein [Bacteroidota bacterium]
MKTNMGKFDRLVRIVVAVAIAVLYSSNMITGALAIVLLIVAVAFVITSFVGFCPLYLPLKLSTKKKKQPAA